MSIIIIVNMHWQLSIFTLCIHCPVFNYISKGLNEAFGI